MSSTPVKPVLVGDNDQRPSREEALKAVRTLLAWAGDDPDRPGLIDTPKRVVDAYGEWFDGYDADPAKELGRTFEDVQGYDDMVLLRDIEVESHCEHHMAPFIGKAYVAYIPNEKVVGISKLARVVEIYSRRLQTQEVLTNQIADAIESNLAAGRGHPDRRGTSVHDHPRRAPSPRFDPDDPVHRRVQDRRGAERPFPQAGARALSRLNRFA